MPTEVNTVIPVRPRVKKKKKPLDTTLTGIPAVAQSIRNTSLPVETAVAGTSDATTEDLSSATTTSVEKALAGASDATTADRTLTDKTPVGTTLAGTGGVTAASAGPEAGGAGDTGGVGDMGGATATSAGPGPGPGGELNPEVGIKLEQWKDASGKDVPVSYSVIQGTGIQWIDKDTGETGIGEGTQIKLYDPPSGLTPEQVQQWNNYNDQIKHMSTSGGYKESRRGGGDAAARQQADIERIYERQRLLLGTTMSPVNETQLNTPLIDAGAGTPISESGQYQANLDLKNQPAGTAAQDAVANALAGVGDGAGGGTSDDTAGPDQQRLNDLQSRLEAQVNYMFKGGPKPEGSDAAGSDQQTLNDLQSQLEAQVNYMFKGGPNPAGTGGGTGGGAGGGTGSGAGGGTSGSQSAIDDLFQKMNSQAEINANDIPPDVAQSFLNNLLSQSPDLTPEQRAVIERQANTAMAEVLSGMSARGMGQSSKAAGVMVQGAFKKQEMIAAEQARIRTENTQFGLEAAAQFQSKLQGTRDYLIAKGGLNLETLKNEQGFSIAQRVTALQEEVGRGNLALDNAKFQQARTEFNKEFGLQVSAQTFKQALETGQLNLEAVKADSATRIAELQTANDFIARSNETDLQAKLGFSKLELEKMLGGQELDLKRIEQGIEKWKDQMGFDIDMTKLDLELEALRAANKTDFMNVIADFAVIGIKGASLFATHTPTPV